MEEEHEASKAPSVKGGGDGRSAAPPPPMEVISRASAVSGNTYMHQRRALFQNIKQHDLIGFDDLGRKIIRPIFAEFLGTLILVFVACGSCIAIGTNIVSISLAFGLTVATVAQAIGHVSGAHLNPAVSIGLIPAQGCSIMKALAYIAAQCSGALVGAFMLWIIFPQKSITFGIGTTTISPSLNPNDYVPDAGAGPGLHISFKAQLAALLIEFVITFVLVLLVCGVCDSNRNDVKGSAALAVGFAITIGHLFAVPFCGPSMNPARSIGPAIVAAITSKSDNPFGTTGLEHLWVYIFGPIGGGIAAGFVYRFIFKEKPHEDIHPPHPQDAAHPHTA